MSLVDASAVCRDITPVIDVTGRIDDDTEIPSAVAFADLYGGSQVLDDAASIIELWQQHEAADHPSERGLRVPVGMQSGAPFVLDLRQDGPHALVAGTTGAGKSEFLQALIVGLATMHSPDRVTFLLVDYKGGAAFKECVALPHTVGMVTDLDRNEVRRALVSLNAELHHRELLLQRASSRWSARATPTRHPAC
jgi:S-DNA-T family DNA segregation ATPase FtsK/SpoIIIE